LRNLLVNVSGSYENDSFRGFSLTGNAFNAAARLRYLVNRNLLLGMATTTMARVIAFDLSYTQNVLARLGDRAAGQRLEPREP
jgi:hypothetical protein